jgi:hypothetical protein
VNRLATVLAVLALSCAAAEVAWPPATEVQSRIAALRQTIGDSHATAASRDAARTELLRLLMNPATPARDAANPKPPRAAIEPLPPLVKPLGPIVAPAPSVPALAPTASPLAAPSKSAVPFPDNRGSVLVPSGRNAIDPRTGSVLIDAGNGFVDPATGRFVPKP